MIYLLLLLLLLMIPVVFHIAMRWSRMYRYLKVIPGPRPLPFFGNLLIFNVSSMSKLWEMVREINKKFYPISKYVSITKGVVNVYHPDDVEIVFTSHKILQKGWLYNYLDPWLQGGLLTTTGEKWRQRRKILTPAFHFEILRKYMEIASEEADKFIENLKSRDKETTCDLMNICSNYTLNIICEAAMGVKLDSLENKAVESYRSAIFDMGKIIVYRIPRPYIKEWTMPLFYKLHKRHQTTVNTLRSFSKKIIEERVEYTQQKENNFLNEFYEETNENGMLHESEGKNRRLAMLDLLLAAKNKGLIDDKGVHEEVDTFTFEGHDTTGMALVFIMMLLAEHKDEQERARSEVKAALDATDGKLGKKDVLSKLNYLERCIKESLRLYPAVATVSRYATEDIQLKNAFVPAGAQLIIHLYDTHRDPNFWTEPDKFQPDRFLPENSKNRHPFAYVPFAAGPRNCIGQKFAMMEMKFLIAYLLYDFYLEPVDRLEDMKLSADIVLRPSKPVHIKFIRIDK